MLSKNFDPSINTIVSEWDLVCDWDWVMSTITTVQMFGLLIGAFVSGQIGDLYGRKPTYFLSLLILLVFNIIATFSNSWQMFAVVRFFIGIGSGWYLTVDVAYITEFIPARYRSIILFLPFWPIGAMFYALLAWLIRDWKYIQIACAVFCLPWFLSIRTIPESYRWLVSHKRIDEAYEVMKQVAQMNRRPYPNKERLVALVKMAEIANAKERKYTIIDVFRNKQLLKITVLLAICWVTCGYSFYAILFGVQQLSGVLYVNMALLGLMESTQFVMSFIANCIGRRLACFVFFLLGGVCGLIVGILQHLNNVGYGNIINGFAYTTKISVAGGWMTLIVYSSELYPTVVRNVGFGFQNTMSRVGSMIAPQLVFASSRVPGIMYLTMGGLFFVAACCVLLLKETNNIALENTIEVVTVKIEKAEFDETSETKYTSVPQDDESKTNHLTI